MPVMDAPTGQDRPALRLGVAQLAPRLRDMEGNAARIADAAAQARADLLLTPALSLPGYDVGDAVHRLGMTIAPGMPVPLLHAAGAGGDVVVGLIEDAPGGPYNSACVIGAGHCQFRHRKLYLPTYGMFDEGRWFGRGSELNSWRTDAGWHCGLLICEDFWHPGLAYVLASRGVDVLLVQAAAPGRGVWQGGEHGTFASSDIWERIARTTAQLYGIAVALCNRVGVEGGVSFAGGSLIVGPDGTVLARAGSDEEEVLVVEVTASALRRARQPYAHSRDDDAGLVARELQRVTA
jgi:predicted amidohydrolase